MQTPWREEALTAAQARWLVRAEGRDVVADLAAAIEAGAEDLSLARQVRDRVGDPSLAAAAHSCAAARVAARGAGRSLPWWTPSALEQASHPQVAAWRSRRYVDGPVVVDLTAGCGGDAEALVDVAPLVACERHEGRVVLLAANLADRALVVQGDARLPPVDATVAWADPGRRDAGRRLRHLAELRPSVPQLRARSWVGLGVAVSPAVDLEDPDIGPGVELEFVQVGAQLVEATLWHGELRDRGPGPAAQRSATLLPAGRHVRGAPTPPVEVLGRGEWLVTPAPALVRARLADGLAAERGLGRVATGRALFWGPRPAGHDGWFRSERVVGVSSARPRTVRDLLSAEAPDEAVEVVLHGVDVDVRDWLRRLGTPTGPHGVRVHLVRDRRGAIAIVGRPSDTSAVDGG